MLIVCLGLVILFMIGGLLLVIGGVVWNYGLVVVGMFIILLLLLSFSVLLSLL